MKIAAIVFKYGVLIEDPCCYPIGFMYVLSSLKQAGHEVKVLNLNLWDYDIQKEIEGYDAVVMTGFDEFIPAIKKVGETCREMGIKTVLGGAWANYKTEDALKAVDVVVLGEGDFSIHEALKLDKGVHTSTLPDLSKVPWPDYDGIGIEEYHRRHERRYMGIITARGCPFPCRFCRSVAKPRFRPMEDALAEVGYYIDHHKIKALIVNDNTFNLRKDRWMQFCEFMRGKGVIWSAAIRVNPLDEEMVRVGHDCGLRFVVIGVESFDQARLDAMNKRIKSDDIYRALDLLEKYKVNYHGNVIVGIPGDTMEDVRREVASIPVDRKVYPVYLERFIGTNYEHALADQLTDQQRKDVKSAFAKFGEEQEKRFYSEFVP